MKTIKVNIGGNNQVSLEANDDGSYQVFDGQGIWLGDVNPQEIADWTEDPIVLEAIIEELLEEGILTLPRAELDYDDEE